VKKFDKYSVRGIVFTILGLAGITYELFGSKAREALVIILYSVVVLMGILLLFRIKEPDF
jgi:predicted membrane channel-forming protein YqfA (hemolysin III family)